MCLISILPKGTVKYSDKVTEFIENGFHANSSGSGFMYKKNGENFVYIKKGYFNLEKLLADLKEANLTDDDELVIHHRIRTSGLANNLNTHPFVVSSDHNEVITLDGKVDKPCLAHNGVFSVDKYEKLNPDFSDTYAFTRYIMANVNVLNLFKTEDEVFETIADKFIGYNKIVLLFPDRDLVTYGKFEEDEGYLHSNGGYRNRYIRNRGGVETCSVPNMKLTKQSQNGQGNIIPFCQKSKTSLSKKEFTPSILINRYRGEALYFDKSIIASGIRLDGSIIRITESNYNHFYIVSKKEPICNKPNVLFSFSETFQDFNPLKQSFYNALHTSSRNAYIKTEKEILSEYWFYPKFEYNKIYADYLHLMEKCGKLSAKSFKKLTKTLTIKLNTIVNKRQKLKIGNDLYLKYKRIDEIINLKSLYLYYEYWSIDFPNNNVFVVNATETKIKQLINDTYKEESDDDFLKNLKSEPLDTEPIEDESLLVMTNVHND